MRQDWSDSVPCPSPCLARPRTRPRERSSSFLRRAATRCRDVGVGGELGPGEAPCAERRGVVHFFSQPWPRPGRCRRDVSARNRGLEASGLSPTRRRAGCREARRPVISGECRVETLPFGSSPEPPGGRKLAIDGLRLRLDLRIVPSAAGGDDAAAAAIWRIENAQLATLPLGIAASYRTLAVAAGLGAMLLALGVWFVGAPGAPTTMGAPSTASGNARTLPTAAIAPSSPIPGSPIPASPMPASPVSGSPVPSSPSPASPASSGVARAAAAPESTGSPGQVAPSASAAPVSGSRSPGVAVVPALPASAVPGVPPASAVPGVAPRIATAPGIAAASAPAAATDGAAGTAPAIRAARGEPPRAPRPASGQHENVRAAVSPVAAAQTPAATTTTAAVAPRAASGSRNPAPAGNSPARADNTGDDMLDLFGDPK
jgi:hypothetical protein